MGYLYIPELYPCPDPNQRLNDARAQTARRISDRLRTSLYRNNQPWLVVRGGWLGRFKTTHPAEVYSLVAAEVGEIDGLEIIAINRQLGKTMLDNGYTYFKADAVQPEDYIQVVGFDGVDINHSPSSIPIKPGFQVVHDRQIYPLLEAAEAEF